MRTSPKPAVWTAFVAAPAPGLYALATGNPRHYIALNHSRQWTGQMRASMQAYRECGNCRGVFHPDNVGAIRSTLSQRSPSLSYLLVGRDHEAASREGQYTTLQLQIKVRPFNVIAVQIHDGRILYAILLGSIQNTD
jgi:hypothetical protein